MPERFESFPSQEEDTLETQEELGVKKEYKDFIESHKEKVTEGLARLVQEHAFVLVGERHSPEVEPIRQEITNSLAHLKELGLTTLAVELNAKDQHIFDTLDFSDPNIKEALKAAVTNGKRFPNGSWDMIIEAKKAGLKLILIDCAYEDVPGHWTKKDEKNYVLWNNARDKIIFSNLEEKITPEERVLIYIGSAHVSKKPVQEYSSDPRGYAKVKRLGAYLAEKYGDKEVASVRYVDVVRHEGVGIGSQRFDALPELESKAPSPYELYDTPDEPVILPDESILKGNKELSASDYIVTMIKSEKEKHD